MRGLSLVAASGGHSSSRCAGLSLSRPLLLRSTGSRRAGSVVVAHGPSCSVACGIFPDQGSNPCPLHWQTDSQPLRHQGNPATDNVNPILQMRRSGSLERLNDSSIVSQSVGGSAGKWSQSLESQCLRSNSSSLLTSCVVLGHLPSLSLSFLSCRTELPVPTWDGAVNRPESNASAWAHHWLCALSQSFTL